MLTSSEAVSKWHPDKMADEVADYLMENVLAVDPKAHTGIEVLLKGDTCVLSGEVKAKHKGNFEYADWAKYLLFFLEPWKTYHVIDLISRQSLEIDHAVSHNRFKKTGAGDQGIMVGYANTTDAYAMPREYALACELIRILENDTIENHQQRLLGDAKAQVTIDEFGQVKTLLVSACTSTGWTDNIKYVREYLKRLILAKAHDYPDLAITDFQDVHWLLNPAGLWTIGGPDADCGLTGRKTVADAYGPLVAGGGGAQAGKDPSKVDRSGFLMARHIARDILKQPKEAKQDLAVSVQLSYAIGLPEPVGVKVVDSNGKDYTAWVRAMYDLTPDGIYKTLDLAHRHFHGLSLWEEENYGVSI